MKRIPQPIVDRAEAVMRQVLAGELVNCRVITKLAGGRAVICVYDLGVHWRLVWPRGSPGKYQILSHAEYDCLTSKTTQAKRRMKSLTA